MSKKVVGSIAAVVAMGTLLAGCGSNTSGSGNGTSGGQSGNVTINFLEEYPAPPQSTFFQQAVKKFEQQNPGVKINLITADNNNYKTKIQVMMASQTPPDIYFSWGGYYAEKYVNAGRALNLSPYIQKDTSWSNNIIPSLWSAYTFNGKTYGVPLYSDVKLFMYNKDIFKKLGLSIPTTFDQLISDLQVIKKAGYTPIAFGDNEDWAIGHYLTTLNARMVPASVIQSDDNPATAKFTDPGYVAALNKLKELEPYMSPQSNAVSDTQASNDFLAGKAALYYNESMSLVYGNGNAIPKFNWGWFNFPSVAGGQGDQTELTGAPEGFMISPQSKNIATDVKFLEFLTSPLEGTQLYKVAGLDSSVKGAVNSSNAHWWDAQEVQMTSNTKNMAMWLDTAMNGQVANAYLSNAQQFLAGQETAQQVMQAVQQAAAQVKSTTP